MRGSAAWVGVGRRECGVFITCASQDSVYVPVSFFHISNNIPKLTHNCDGTNAAPSISIIEDDVDAGIGLL